MQLGLGCSDGTYLEGTSRCCMWPRALACGGGTALVSAGAGGTVRGGSCGSGRRPRAVRPAHRNLSTSSVDMFAGICCNTF